MRTETWVSARLLKRLAKLTPPARERTTRNEDICGVVSHRGWLCATDQRAFVRADVGMRREGTCIISAEEVKSLPAGAMLTCDWDGWVDEDGRRYGRPIHGDWVDFAALRRAMEGEDQGYAVSPRYMADVMAVCAEIGVNPVITRGAHGHIVEGHGAEGAVEALVMGVI